MPHHIRTERLLLRPPVLADAPAFHRIANHRRMTRMTGSWIYPFTDRYVRQRFAPFLAGRSDCGGLFMILAGREIVGSIGYYGEARGAHEVGYWIGDGHEGHGYAKEALRAFLWHGFRADRVSRFAANVFIDNPASVRILTSVGFRQTGTRQGWSADRGCHSPQYSYLLRREWFVT